MTNDTPSHHSAQADAEDRVAASGSQLTMVPRNEEEWREARALELQWHEHFKRERIRGEWFQPSRRLLRAVAKYSDEVRPLISDQRPPAVDESFDERAERIRRLVRGAIA